MAHLWAWGCCGVEGRACGGDGDNVVLRDGDGIGKGDWVVMGKISFRLTALT